MSMTIIQLDFQLSCPWALKWILLVHSLPPHPTPPADTHSDSRRQYTYSLKIINPKKKSQFLVEKFRRLGTFSSPREVRLSILTECEGLVPDNTEFDFGYFKGGRGSAKVWIKSEEDLKSMYETYVNEKEISLWCLGSEKEDGATSVSNTNKRKLPNADDRQGSKRQAIRDEVEDIFTSLKEKHGSTYNAAQLRLWANMLQIGTHRDYDEPPKVPMFGVNAKTGTKSPCLADALSNVAEGFMRALKSPGPAPSCSSSPTRMPSHEPLQEMGVSPGKCAALRSQYIQQLKELHQLLEATAISKEEYEEQKAAVLHKMQGL